MKGVLIGIAIFLAIILVAVLGFKLYDYIVAYDFYQNSEVAFETPGVRNSAFVPQGMEYVESDKVFLFTGFMNDGKNSRVYVRHEDGTLTHTGLMWPDGSAYTEHTGGIAQFGDYVFITGTTEIDVFLYSDILQGKETAVLQGSFKTFVDPSHCTVYSDETGDYFLTGSFYYEGEYDTPDCEHIVTPAGDKNTSVILVYRLNKDVEFGIELNPIAAISTRLKVQGICFTDDGHLVLSNSWGITPSELHFYDTSKMTCIENYHYFGVNESGLEYDVVLPMYFADSDSHVGKVLAPPMSEEIVYHDGKIYVLNESASRKYLFGKLTTGNNLYAYDFSAFKK